MSKNVLSSFLIFYLPLSVFFLQCNQNISGAAKQQVQKNVVINKSPLGNPDLSNYIFAWGDDFNGSSLDTKKWFLRWEDNPNNSAPNTRSNIIIKDGLATLIAKAPPAGPSGGAEISTETLHYFRYGYFEIRAQLSSGVGNECAFWITSPATSIVSNPFNPAISGAEIDIFENGIAKGINKLYYSLHWNGYEPPHAAFITQVDSLPGIYSGFHTFALEWTPKKYAIYIDGVQRSTTDTIISHIPSFIILGMGPGGFGGSAPLFPNPSSFIIDYVHVYNRRPEVTLYGNINYRGWISNGLLAGSYTTAQLVANGGINNTLSSLEIPAGWKVTLFDEDNFNGNSTVLSSGDVVDLGLWRRITSSLKITSP